MVTISDRKLDTVADIYTAQDYYPFGMQMPERSWTHDTAHRYGFQGQEYDTEISTYTAEYWQYDGRLGRRWNIDPIVQLSKSGYSVFSNNSISRIDPNGLTDYYDRFGNYMGTDGINNKRNFVMVEVSHINSAKVAMYGTGFMGWWRRNISKKKLANDLQFTADEHAQMIELPDLATRRAMAASVDASDAPSYEVSDNEGGFHEEGGVVLRKQLEETNEGEGPIYDYKVVMSKPGSYADPASDKSAAFSVQKRTDEQKTELSDLQHDGYTLYGKFHVHPSGTNRDFVFDQHPSEPDIDNVEKAEKDGSTVSFNVVFGAGNRKVYFFGSRAKNSLVTLVPAGGTSYIRRQTHQAEMPLDQFVNPLRNETE